jgi:transcriptional antiterminator RfaH
MNQSEPAWYCIRTLHKHEHIAYSNLRQIEELEAFYPRLRSNRRFRGKMISAIEPLFPCYIFARFVLPNALDRVRFTFGVKNVINFSSIWPTIPDAEIEELRSEFGSDEVLDRPLPELAPGTEVDIIQGPLNGFRAVVSYYMPAAQRVKLLVDLLSRRTMVEMDLQSINVIKRYPEALLTGTTG